MAVTADAATDAVITAADVTASSGSSSSSAAAVTATSLAADATIAADVIPPAANHFVRKDFRFSEVLLFSKILSIPSHGQDVHKYHCCLIHFVIREDAQVLYGRNQRGR